MKVNVQTGWKSRDKTWAEFSVWFRLVIVMVGKITVAAATGGVDGGIDCDGPIKLFPSTQKYYQAIGIFPSQLQPSGQFHWKNLVILCACILCLISIMTYFLFEANSLAELAITFYGCTGLVSAIFYYLTNIFQRENIFELIQKFENFIEKRKFRSFFSKLNMKLMGSYRKSIFWIVFSKVPPTV